MAAGDVFIDSDGKIGLDATGKIRLVDASSDCPDCCDDGCTAGTTCVPCADTTPSTYIVTFTNVSLCSCGDGPGNDVKATWVSGNVINGDHTLTQVPGSPCVWRKELEDAVNIYTYTSSDGSCTGTETLKYANEDLIITLQPFFNGDLTVDWVLTIYGEQGSPSTGFFAKVEVADTETCETVPDFPSNNYDCSSTFGRTEVGTGGSATVVCG